MSDEPKISAHYRELPREEPPRHLDDAILAAARRAAEMRPAPLVVPSGRRKWYFPLAAAAIIVLAVAVTVHVERERPDPELVATSPTAPREEPRVMQAPPAAVPAPAPAPAPVRKASPPPKEFVPDPKPQAVPAPAPAPAPATPPAAADSIARGRLEEERQAERRRARGPQEQAAAAPPEAPAAAKAMRRAPEESRREVSGLGALAYRSPEQWLQGIDDLKRQGRHDEAEKQLAEFRKRYPDYRIPEAILEKFEKR